MAMKIYNYQLYYTEVSEKSGCDNEFLHRALTGFDLKIITVIQNS